MYTKVIPCEILEMLVVELNENVYLNTCYFAYVDFSEFFIQFSF